ncbi:MFS transporter [Bacillus sp. FJAT-42315]|uniref:MFS transporter n=1 Tax=Bacillus sp. FJAT-42315 TaxID=2014077 RepID=UPI000C235BE2|nr:MFS transporter [Bacillus sp. FJAT-42315]
MTRHKGPALLYLSQSFASQLFFWMVFTVNLLYYVQVVEMNALQLVLVGTVLEITVLICEIPTGLIADYKGRKFSIVLGYSLIGLGFFIEGLFPTFTTILIAQVIWGIGYTCISGALQAWVTDEVGLNKVDKVFINSTKYENVGNLFGILLGIVIGYISVQVSILLGAIGFLLLSLYLSRNMTETRVINEKKKESFSFIENIKSMLSSVFSSFKANIILRYVLLIACIVGIYSEGFDRLWISHIADIIEGTLSEKHMIFVVGGVQFVTSVFTIIVFQFLNRMSEKIQFKSLYKGLRLSYFILIVALICFAFSTNLIGLICFFIIIQVIREITSTFENIWFNQLITDSSKRATFFSVKGQVDAIGQIGGGPVAGLISQYTSIKIGLAASALLLSPVLFIYQKLLKTRD